MRRDATQQRDGVIGIAVHAIVRQGERPQQPTPDGPLVIDAIPITRASRVRLTIDRSRAVPLIRTIGLYQAP